MKGYRLRHRGGQTNGAATGKAQAMTLMLTPGREAGPRHDMSHSDQHIPGGWAHMFGVLPGNPM